MRNRSLKPGQYFATKRILTLSCITERVQKILLVCECKKGEIK
jgi:hypothetical protein